ncbi:MAG: signal peptidase I [Actinomycetota bacterium]|nr:signal peptidase I [Actinomycetota bacterium]
MLKRIIKWSIISLIILVFLLAVASVFTRLKSFESLPSVKGYRPLVVLGGSMEPAIKVGSIAMVKTISPSDVEIGDIITYKTPTNPRTYTTHRVIKISKRHGNLYFKTKGDANEDPDRWTITSADVLGKVTLTIPYFGYFIHFARTRLGFILLVIVPGVLIIVGEIRNILKSIKEARSI